MLNNIKKWSGKDSTERSYVPIIQLTSNGYILRNYEICYHILG